MSGHEDHVAFAAYSPDGTRIVTASDDKTARVWDARTGHEFTVLSGHLDTVSSAAYSPDGARIVTASDDKPHESGMRAQAPCCACLPATAGYLYHAAFSPDGTRIVTASDDKTARIWDARTGAQLRTLSGHDGIVLSAAFSPDGTRIVTASDDKTARIWDARTGDQLIVLSGHDKSIYFSRVLAGRDAHRHRVERQDGAHLGPAHRGPARGALRPLQSRELGRVLPGRQAVVTASDDKTARIWDTLGGFSARDVLGHRAIFSSPPLFHLTVRASLPPPPTRPHESGTFVPGCLSLCLPATKATCISPLSFPRRQPNRHGFR